MENINDKVQDYLLDRVKFLEQENKQLKERFFAQHLNDNLKREQELNQIEKIIDYINISILDGTNGYWQHFRSNGSEYMTDKDLENLLMYVKENVMEKVENNELWN